MHPVERALWYIESHIDEDLQLEGIASASGVSKFHLARLFAYTYGHPVMRYVRLRRLTRAARQLADGAPDILSVAMASGYASHEAFSRAFRDHFGVAPDTIRKRTTVDDLPLTEAIDMPTQPFDEIEPTRFEHGKQFLVAGFARHYSAETIADIPSQWQSFAPHIGAVPGQIGSTTYGVCYNGDGSGNIDYLSGVEVASFDGLPDEFDRLVIEKRKYAVFLHADHISTIRRTVHAIWGNWLPQGPYEAASAPDFELYDERFDGKTGNGGVEIWIPLKE